MAKPKTMIIYAASAGLATLTSDVTVARERGQAVRLIGIEEFRGETEQNAGAVFVQRQSGDELVFDRIQQAYPMIVVQDYGSEGVDLDDHDSFQPEQADETIKELRLRLIAMGGSAPAGADAGQLADLIAAQLAHTNRTPILPSPATQGTTIPDSTPIMQRPDGDKLIDANATGTSAAALAASEEQSGQPASGDGTAGASASTTAGTSDAPNSTDGSGSDSGDDGAGTGSNDGSPSDFDADAFIGKSLDGISDEDISALSAEQRTAVIAAERDREQPRVTLLRRLGETS